MVSTFNIVAVVFLSLISLYALISALLVYSAITRITGKELRDVLMVLFITISVGFLYSIWLLLKQAGSITLESRFLNGYVNYVAVIFFFALLIYLSFLTRELGRKYGFKVVGKRIVQEIQKKQKLKKR